MKQGKMRIAAAAAALATFAGVCTVMPAVPASAATLLIAEFETTNDSFQGRGGASAEWTSDESYTQDCSLYVSSRTSAWQGAQRDAAGLLKAGSTYEMSCAVYQNSGEPVEMKFSLQYTGADGTAYDKIALETVESGKWTLLENPEYTVPDGASNMVIYVETTKSLTSFYVDTVTINGAPSVIKNGDANGDLKVNIADAVSLVKYLTAEETSVEIGADMDGNKKINAVDLSLLKAYLLNPPAAPSIEGSWDDYQETATPQMQQVYKDGVARVGNTARIREKIAKAQSGETVTIGYLGGSITEGGSATSKALTYAQLSFDYFSETFGKGGNVKYVNAGLSGTSSVVGNIRVESDIFAHNCDIIFIEFAVNDQGGDRFQKSYESLVKKCLMQENAPAVILITLCQKSGGSNQDWMEKVAKNYDLALISGKNAVMNGIQAGTLNWDRDYGSNDTIHPGNGGHRIIADIISFYYRQALRSENASDSYEIPTSEVFGANYANSKLVKLSSLDGFNAGSWRAGTNNQRFPDGFTYTKNGNNPLTFKTNGKGLVILFQSNSSNMGAINVTVNGKTQKVDSQLQWTWGGPDGDIGYYSPTSGPMDVSITSANGGTFVIYAVAVVE